MNVATHAVRFWGLGLVLAAVGCGGCGTSDTTETQTSAIKEHLLVDAAEADEVAVERADDHGDAGVADAVPATAKEEVEQLRMQREDEWASIKAPLSILAREIGQSDAVLLATVLHQEAIATPACSCAGFLPITTRVTLTLTNAMVAGVAADATPYGDCTGVNLLLPGGDMGGASYEDTESPALSTGESYALLLAQRDPISPDMCGQECGASESVCSFYFSGVSRVVKLGFENRYLGSVLTDANLASLYPALGTSRSAEGGGAQ